MTHTRTTTRWAIVNKRGKFLFYTWTSKRQAMIALRDRYYGGHWRVCKVKITEVK